MNGNKPQGSSLYAGYLKQIQHYYDRDPVVQASLQLILSIFTVAFFMFLAIRPTLSTITTLLKSIEDQRLADQRLGIKIVQLAEAQEFLLSQGEEINVLSQTAIPERPEVKRLAREIELIANQSGVFITTLNFQSTPLVGDKSSLTESSREQISARREQFVTFGFTIVGEQVGLVNFLDQLEKMDRVVTLTNVVFSIPQTSGENSFPLSATGRATAYYLSLAPATVPAPLNP